MNIKICGITRLEDALDASALGVSAVGFNFYPKSKRYIAPTEAFWIGSKLPEEVQKWGVFVNSTIEEIEKIREESGIDVVQLHGDEDMEFARECKKRGMHIVKAVRPATMEDARRVLDDPAISAWLVDAADPENYGGTGKIADWEIAKSLASRLQVILAGGLKLANVAEAIKAVNPIAIDVCSGVEKSPGVKSAALMQEFIRRVDSVS